jgi:nitrogen fixation protein NifB
MTETTIEKRFYTHPCFHQEACGSWGRIHLPVAPNCNIQCNFCNRLYDCANENRPGVTRHIYTPQEAVSMLQRLLYQRSDISVAGIAGPGDPLCEPDRTLETLRAIHAQYPRLLLCVSTNGLNLPACADALADAGVTHVTVTVNAIQPQIGRHIYAFVKTDSQLYKGTKAAQLLCARQNEGIIKLKRRGIIVKINTVVIPGVNDKHISDIARQAAIWQADILNCLALIPVHDTVFAHIPAPTASQMTGIRKEAARYLPQMTHCCRCRADAVGRLHSTGT